MNIKKLCINAMFIALTFISTAFISFAIPLGYANLGSCIILFTAYYFGNKSGMIAGGIGSSLADIYLGYSYWAIPTLIIKGLAGYIAGRSIARAICSMVVVVAGYVAAGAIIEIISGASVGAGVSAGITSAPGLGVEAVVNMIVYILAVTLSNRAGLDKYIKKNVN